MDKKVGSSSNDVIQMWKRLGDCSSSNKTLTVTVDGISQTYTFNENYLSTKPNETEIMSSINSIITNAVIKKYVPSYWDNINTDEKVYVIAGEGGLLEGQYIDNDGIICVENENKDNIYGRVLEDGAEGELVQVWIGKGIVLFSNDGEYGIGSDGKLSPNATTKIGFIKSNAFFRY